MPWDYTGRNTNIDGLIRLDFAPLWFATGLLFEQITKKRKAGSIVIKVAILYNR